MAKKPSIYEMRVASGTKGPVMRALKVRTSEVIALGLDNSRSWYWLFADRYRTQLGINAAGEYVLINQHTPRDRNYDPIGAMYAVMTDDMIIDAADAFSDLIRADRLARRAAV